MGTDWSVAVDRRTFFSESSAFFEMWDEIKMELSRSFEGSAEG